MPEWDDVQFDLYSRYRKVEKQAGNEPLEYKDWIKQFKGEIGQKGDKGEPGKDGPQGERGERGFPGVDGKNGATGPKGDRGEQGERGEKGARGSKGFDGVDGENGWTPILAVVEDGERRVLKVNDWTGGSGLKPEFHVYIGENGFTRDIKLATDIRGGIGKDGQDARVGGTSYMSPRIFNELHSIEDTLVGSEEVTFPFLAKQITIANDSTTEDLEFKFEATGVYATLKPNEKTTVDIQASSIFLNEPGNAGTDSTLDYRIWLFG